MNIHRRFILLIPIIFLIFITILRTGTTEPYKSMVKYILAKKICSNEMDDQFRKIVPPILHSSKFKDRWQLNDVPQNGFLNFYVIDFNRVRHDRKFQHIFKQWRKLDYNCLSIKYTNSIICDVTLLKQFLQRKGVIDLIKKYPNADVATKLIQEHQISFLTWVIGHEVGHQELGHLHSTFITPSFDDMVSNASFFQKEEFAADSFLLSSVKYNKELQVQIASMAIEVINREIEHKVGEIPAGVGILFDYTNEKMVEYSTKGSHPEFVLRLIRILKIIATQQNDVGLKSETDAFIRNLKKTLN